MLQLFDFNHIKLHGLTNYKDLKRERTLDGEEILSFLYPQSDSKYGSIQEETYLRTKDNEYVVKEINIDDDWTGFVAKINVENLKGNAIERFESIEQTITDCLNLALVSTGWTVGSCDVTKKRTVRMSRKSTYDIIQEARKIYRCDYKFDTINKKIYIYASMGTDKGSYFSEELNLIKLNVQSNSYDYCTRIIPIGKDGLQINDINDGKQFVENHQYSNKIITVYWEDNRYTVVESLKEDAIARLNELSKPVKSYKAEIFDLARLNDKYKNILDYDLGDTISLLSKDKKVKDKQRIVKIIEYPEEPERNTCEIANRIMSLEDLQVDFEEAADTVDSITTSDGGIDGSKIDSIEWSQVKNVSIYTADIQEMNVVFGRIGTLETTTAHITNGVIDNATIDVAKVNNLSSTYATITNLNSATANISTLQSQVASINNVLAGNVGAENLAAGAIQANSAVIANGAISSAQIASLDVGKLNAGDISTTKFRIVSTSGNMLISDNTIQIKDASRVRVQIGKDASNDYNMYVWDNSGNLMFDATGLKASGIKSKIIVDNMVSDTANINGSKIEKESLITQINGATTTLKSSRVKLDTENQTLDVAFTSLKSTVTSQGNTITSQGTSISTIQGQISSKIWQTDIDSSINNLNTMTKLNGEELISQNFKKGVDDKPFTNGSYSLVNNILASPIAEQYVIKVTNSTFLRSDFIPFDLSRPFYTMITSFNEATTNGVLYIGVEFYDKDKVSLGSNDLVIYSISADTTALPVNTWKTFEGYVNVSPTDSTRLKAAYIRLRILTRWSGNTGVTYIKDISLKQLGSQVLPSTVTRITTAESNINQLNTSISLKVDTSTFNSYKSTNDANITDLQSRMSSAELKITDSSIITTVRNSTAYINDLAAKSNKIIPDTRNDNQPPSWYWTNYPKQATAEFKYRTVLGAPGSSTYGSLTTTVPWSDSSGGSITQVFKSSDGTYERVSTSTSAWSTWKQIEDTAGSQAKIDTFNTNTVVPLTNRVSSAEQKITADAIINTVSSSVISGSAPITAIDDGNTNITYVGTWTNGSNVNCYGGNFKYSSTTNNYMQYTFVGTGINVYAPKDVSYGICEIFIDGISKGTYDLYSATLVFKQKVYTISNLAYGSHIIKIVVKGTKNASSTNYTIVFDYLEVLNSTAVNNTNIVSQINQTAETIKIQANKIDLTGYVTITSLSSSGSVTINCGNISGGTLTLGGAGNGNGWISIKNASNVTMVSLDNTGLYNSSGTFKVTDSKVYFKNAEIADFIGGQTTDMNNVTRPGLQVNVNKIKLRDFNMSAQYGPDGTGELYTLNVWNDIHAFTITQETFDTSDTLSNYQEVFRVGRGGAFALGSRIMYDRGSDTTDPTVQIKDPGKRNGICARYGDGPVGYNYGALVTMSSSGPRFQMYAPHNEGGVSALYFRTGWNDDIKDWKRVATYGERGYFYGVEANADIRAVRLLGYNSRNIYIGDGTDGSRMDAGDGGFRLYTSWVGNADYGLRINSSGGIDVIVNNSTKFSVSSSGSKVGGTYTLDGIDYGMSPVDSPRSLIEDVYIDVDVEEEGTIIELDVLLVRMMDKYAVFPSNGRVEVVSKDKNSFVVKGYTGKVDIRIIGVRKDCVDQYFPIMNDLVA